MPCKTVSLPGGGYAIVCGGRRPKRCHVCGRPSTKLCDFPVKGRTCDKPMCDQHANSVGPDLDYCGPHLEFSKTQEGEKG